MYKTIGRTAVLACWLVVGIWLLSPSPGAALCSGGCLPSQTAPTCLKCGFTLYSHEICLSGSCSNFCDTLSCEYLTLESEGSSQASTCQPRLNEITSPPARQAKVVRLEARI